MEKIATITTQSDGTLKHTFPGSWDASRAVVTFGPIDVSKVLLDELVGQKFEVVGVHIPSDVHTYGSRPLCMNPDCYDACTITIRRIKDGAE